MSVETHSVVVPATYDEFERSVLHWISRRVQSRTIVHDHSARRERTLVRGNPSLRNVWITVCTQRGQSIKLRANLLWGKHRVETIAFSLQDRVTITNRPQFKPEGLNTPGRLPGPAARPRDPFPFGLTVVPLGLGPWSFSLPPKKSGKSFYELDRLAFRFKIDIEIQVRIDPRHPFRVRYRMKENEVRLQLQNDLLASGSGFFSTVEGSFKLDDVLKGGGSLKDNFLKALRVQIRAANRWEICGGGVDLEVGEGIAWEGDRPCVVVRGNANVGLPEEQSKKYLGEVMDGRIGVTISAFASLSAAAWRKVGAELLKRMPLEAAKNLLKELFTAEVGIALSAAVIGSASIAGAQWIIAREHKAGDRDAYLTVYADALVLTVEGKSLNTPAAMYAKVHDAGRNDGNALIEAYGADGARNRLYAAYGRNDAQLKIVAEVLATGKAPKILPAE